MQEEKPQSQNLTFADLDSILKTVLAAQAAQTDKLVEELGRPARDAAQKEHDRLLKRARQGAYEAKVTMESRAAMQAACPHIKDDGTAAFGGQCNQDGYARLFCTRCMKEYPPVRASVDWMRNGIQLQHPKNKRMQRLTETEIYKWADWTAKNAPPPPRIPRSLYPQEKAAEVTA